MNNTITSTGNPYQNNNSVVIEGTSRVAKLNNKDKRPAIAKYWADTRPDMKVEREVPSVGSREHGYDVILGRLGMTMEAFETFSIVNGYRKLKVNNLVNSKAEKVYNASSKLEVVKEIKKDTPVEKVEVKEELPKEIEAFVAEKSVDMPKREEIQENVAPIELPPHPEERQEPLPNESRTMRHSSDVINAPSRVLARTENDYPIEKDTPFPSRTERNSANVYSDTVNSLVGNSSAYQNTLDVGASGRNLDMINSSTHYGSDGEGIFSETVKLQEQTSAIQNEIKELDSRVINMEQELAARERRVKEKEAMHKQNEYNKAKKAYRLASEEKYNKTGIYKDLANKIKELQAREAQLDELNSSYEDEESYGMRRVA